MADKQSNKKLDELRQRLYSRDENPRPRTETSQNDREVFGDIKSPAKQTPVHNAWEDISTPQGEPTAHYQKENFLFKRYRAKLILIGLVFFGISVLLSSAYMLLGHNSVSGANISIGITAPLSLGGGEVMQAQVGVTNNNSIPIETATLIVDYPAGTRSVEDEKTLYTERIPITEQIAANETHNIPIKARVFGEENQEEEIKVSIEYRMVGSSATFYKDAEPIRFKISHAPVVIKTVANNKVSANQENKISVTVTSNSANPIYNVLVRADYPSGFDFVKSTPETMSGRNVWNIPELKPEQSVTIDMYGKFSGDAGENKVIKFQVGVASERDPGNLASVLATTDTEFSLENPFISTKVTINNNTEEVVSVSPGAQTNVSIEIENSAGAPVYDGVVKVKLSGNSLVDSQVSVNGGYYDSNTRTVTFDGNSNPRLKELKAGAKERLSFAMRLDPGINQSPQVVASISVSGKRLSSSSPQEEISDVINRTVKVEGQMVTSGRIIDVLSGSVPPVVGRKTSYRIEFSTTNSGNNVAGAVVTATLPAYVEWDGNGAGDGSWNYNPTNRTVEWRVGNVDSGHTSRGTFGITLSPSSSILGSVANLVSNIQLRADDSFTGTVVRASGGNVTAELANQRGSGTVQSN